MEIFQIILVSLASGLSVSFGTRLLVGKTAAYRFPGGSFGAGLLAGYYIHPGIGFILLGGLFGIGGWVLYRIWPGRRSSTPFR